MKRIELIRNIDELSEEKSPEAYVNSEATIHFFYCSCLFVSQATIDDTPVKDSSTVIKISGDGLVNLCIGREIKVGLVRLCIFSSKIISVDFYQMNMKSYPLNLLMVFMHVPFWLGKVRRFSPKYL